MEHTKEELDFEFEQAMTFSGIHNKKAGRLVETSKGIEGRTYNHEDYINGKIIVHTSNGKLLCDPITIRVKGFVD